MEQLDGFRTGYRIRLHIRPPRHFSYVSGPNFGQLKFEVSDNFSFSGGGVRVDALSGSAERGSLQNLDTNSVYSKLLVHHRLSLKYYVCGD